VRHLAETFERTRSQGRAALIGYLPAGYPSYAGCVDALLAMVDGGVDIVEVGLPYSDPLMDGPTIQHAAEAALAGGVSTRDVLKTVEAVAASGAATLVMSYWNPIERFGVGAFADAMAAAGGAGVITPDLTPDEAGPWLDAVAAAGIDPVFLVAPSSTQERIRRVADASRGFVYVASTMGVTGARAQVSNRAEALVARVRPLTDLPLAVGLGVSTGAQAAEVAAYADGVIVGSAFVRLLIDAPDPAAGIEAVRGLAVELAAGVRGARTS